VRFESGRPSAIVFDLDGTLIDSRRDIAEAANHALARGGFSTLPHDELESYVGDGAPLLLSRAARLEVTHEKLHALVADFLDYYNEHAVDFTDLMPGAAHALDELSSYRLGLCTNKARCTTLTVLRGLGLTARFHAIVAGDDLPQKKPDPAMVLEAGRQLGTLAADLIMVGDGAQDVLAGRAAGALTVGVRGGIQAFERLAQAKPDYLLDTLADLPQLVSQLASGTPR
jgi:phosphoglycolate phosphatase